MDKKDIYEHLAKIYLDASSRGRKRKKIFPELSHSVLLGAAGFLALFFLLAAFIQKSRNLKPEVSLVLLTEAAKINFHFDPARKETLHFDLKDLDLSRYKTLAFSVRKKESRNRISLKVEFSSVFGEKSEIYFKDIPHRWRDYYVDLSEFDKISSWRNIKALSFVIEEWNTTEKKGVVYLDNVRFLK